MKPANFDRSASEILSLWMLVLSLVCTPNVFASVDPDPDVPSEAGATREETFPIPVGLEANVQFWRDVYATWSLGQVVLHDSVYPALVYEVIDLPGPPQEGMTQLQRDIVAARRAALQEKLLRLAALGDDPAFLSDEELALRDRIAAIAGPGGVAGAYERLRSQRGLRERFRRGIEVSGRYERIFRRIFRENGLPEDLAYLPHVESSFQNHARSTAGAAGMWQFTRAAGQRFLRMDAAIDERLDPILAARGSARYLRRAYDVLGDWALAVTSYNHGINGMSRAKAQFGTDFGRIAKEYRSPAFGFASRNFYAEFLAAREVARNHRRYFPEGVTLHPAWSSDNVVLERPLKLKQVAQRFGLPVKELAALNPGLSAGAVRGSVKLAAGTHLWLPGSAVARTGDRSFSMAAVEEEGDAKAPPRGKAPKASAVHVVKRGETLSGIAKRYGISIAALRDLNDLKPRQSNVRIGQRLKVRKGKASGADDGVVHVVRKGDNPALIASAYGVTVQKLLSSNRLTERSIIIPGQRLDIPVSR